MSRRQTQEIREYMARHGVTFNVARQSLFGTTRTPASPSATGSEIPFQVLRHPETAEPNLSSPAVQTAMQLQLQLLGASDAPGGIDSENAFLPLVRHVGQCRGCGLAREMSFEHMPPASAGNDSRARGANALSILTGNDPNTFPRSGWFPAQRGMGAYVLCKPCNELFGRRYVPSYIAFNDDIGLGATTAISNQGWGVIPGFIDVDLEGWPLGDIAREGLVQLLDLGVHGRLIRTFPALSETVLSGSGELPPDVRLGLTLILGSQQGRVSSPMLQVTDGGGPTETVTLFAEVAMAPFSWTLSFTGNGRAALERTADVSSWLALGAGQVAGSVQLHLPVGTIGSAIPGDFVFHNFAAGT